MRIAETFVDEIVALLGAVSLPAQNQVSLTVDATMDYLPRRRIKTTGQSSAADLI
jgi:hypothetical protein